MKISAVIFDLDGTVLENEDEYAEAFKSVLRQFEVYIKVKYPHIAGIGVKENWPYLLSKYKVKTKKTIEELTKETQSSYLDELDYVDLKEGFEECIKALRGIGKATALATSNQRVIVEKIVQKFGLERYFDVIVCAEDVKFNKPDPDLFLKASEKLNIIPEECVVIEDSPAGILAAKRAGMRTVAIARDADHAKTLQDANLVVENFSELTPEKLTSI